MNGMIFTVSPSAASDETFEIKVVVPDFDDATEAEKQVAWNFLSTSSSPRVRIQSVLREAAKNGAGTAALNVIAQEVMDDLLAGRRVRVNTEKLNVIDANDFPGGMSLEQAEFLRENGAVIINI